MRRLPAVAASILSALSFALAAAPAAAPPAPVRDKTRPAAGVPATPAEAAAYEATPSYDETLAFVRRLAAVDPSIKLGFYGVSGQGRPMPYVVVSKERAFEPAAAARLGKPVALIVSGIHSGEIDGKDAMLAIARDWAYGKDRVLLDGATVVWIPIFNVDGHENSSPYNRPNQDGPKRGMGFRTNAAGLDLNRDHMKLVSPEMRALVKLVGAWRPQIHVDNHVTDGCEFAWTLTYGVAEAPVAPAPIDAWLKAHLPAALDEVHRAGYQTGPYVELVDGNDPSKGFGSGPSEPRFSTAYFTLRNAVSILVENHSYKPYKDRVLANEAFLRGLLREIGRDPQALVAASAAAARQEVALGRPDAPPSTIALRYESDPKPDTIRFDVYRRSLGTSVVTGKPIIAYERGVEDPIDVPWFHRLHVSVAVPRPRGYVVRPGWPQIEERLRAHGLVVRRLAAPAEVEAETLRVDDLQLEGRSYQGLVGARGKISRRAARVVVPAGSLFVPADQPDFAVAANLLEPESPDSLFAWGLLDSVAERKEYIDPRVLEAWVREALKDPKTAEAWKAALAEPRFAADERARFLWWYQRTPYYDRTIGEFPYVRLTAIPPSWKLDPAPRGAR